MIPEIATALIAGGASVLGSGISAGANVAGSHKQYKYSARLMEKQFKYNKQMYDYQNAYNSPAAQMARLKAAGLNPNLIYGSGSANASGNATSAPTVGLPSAPSMPHFNFGSLGIQDAINTYYQTKLVQSQVRKNDADTLNVKQQAETEKNRTLTERYNGLLRDQQYIAERLKNEKTEAGKMYWRNEAHENYMILSETRKSLIANNALTDARTKFIQGPQTDEVRARIENLGASLLSHLAQANMFNANAALSRSKIAEVEKIAQYYGQQYLNAQTDGEKKKLDLQLAQDLYDAGIIDRGTTLQRHLYQIQISRDNALKEYMNDHPNFDPNDIPKFAKVIRNWFDNL